MHIAVYVSQDMAGIEIIFSRSFGTVVCAGRSLVATDVRIQETTGQTISLLRVLSAISTKQGLT